MTEYIQPPLFTEPDPDGPAPTEPEEPDDEASGEDNPEPAQVA